jgi:uncharacterized SAM-binding protein YcdF (DUF218 family)
VPLSLYLSALTLAEPLLAVHTGIAPADAIVVLGGNGPARTAKAAALYRAGAAPVVLLTGDGDCLDMRHLLESGGVPRAAILIECRSGTTWENALFSVPMLEQRNVGRALIVTDWFHTRRALACFRTLGPGIAWMTAPVERVRGWAELALSSEGPRIAREPLKLAWYVLRYGIGAAALSSGQVRS